MKRIPRRLAVPLAMGLAGAALCVATSPFASAQSGERVVVREAPPSCAQSVVELGLQGQEVHCVEPPAPTTEEPKSHGPYRLIPPGFVGTLSYEYVGPAQPPRGVVSSDMAVLRTSSLYKAPSYMPGGYSLSSMDTFDGDSETVIRSVYRGPGQPIEVYRVRRGERPIDAYMPSADAPTVIDATTIDGKPAIFSYPRPGSFLDGKGFAWVSFVDGDIETTVTGLSLDLDSAILIAGSVEAGEPAPTTAPSPPRESGGDGVTSGEPAPSAAPPVSATEHRIIEGIATTSALVYEWWHGGDVGQTALDLHNIPDSATPGAAVYYASYALAGPAGFLAVVQNYPGNCTGVRVALLDAGWNAVGLVDYVHIQSSVSAGQWWPVWGSDWTTQPVGTVLSDETPTCKNSVPPGWTGAHLHHAKDNGYPYIQENTDLQSYLIQQGHPNVIQPAYDYINQWVFRAFTIDADGDGCADSMEVQQPNDGVPPTRPGETGAYNPDAWYDFYDVPVPSLIGGPGGTRNRAINIGDVLAVNSYSGVRAGDAPYEADNDGNGIRDGLQYDRSPSQPPTHPMMSARPAGPSA
jgi:hypothetical protein